MNTQSNISGSTPGSTPQRLKLIWVFSVVLLSCATTLAGQAADETMGAYNGLYWRSCPAALKTGFVVGFVEGIKVSDFAAHNRQKYATSATVGEMVAEIDRIYGADSKASLSMPIWFAMRLAVLKLNGVPESEYDKELSDVARKVTPAPDEKRGGPAK